MKTIIKVTIMLMLSVSIVSRAAGQIKYDNDAVLKICLQVAEMEINNHKDNSGMPVLAFLDNGKINKTTSLKWFDNPILFISIEEVNKRGIVCWIEFESFSVGSDSANATFLYKTVGNATKKFILTFSKIESLWCITGNQTIII